MPDKDVTPNARFPSCEQMLQNAHADFDALCRANPLPQPKRGALLTFSRSAPKSTATNASARDSITAQIDNLNKALNDNANGFSNLLMLLKNAKPENINPADNLNTKQTFCDNLVTELRSLVKAHINDNASDATILQYDSVLLQTLIDLSDPIQIASSTIMFNGITESSSDIKNDDQASLTKLVEAASTSGIDGIITELDNDPNMNAHAKMLQARFDVEENLRNKNYVVRDDGKASQTSKLVDMATMLQNATVEVKDDTISIQYSESGFDEPKDQNSLLTDYIEGVMGADSITINVLNKPDESNNINDDENSRYNSPGGPK